MFHLGIYNGTPAFGAVNADLPAVTDPFLTVSNGHLILPIQMYLMAAYATGAFLTTAQIVTPKLRSTSPVNIRGVDLSGVPVTNPNLDEYFWRPAMLNPIDETQVLVSNNKGATTDAETVGLWFGDYDKSLPPGDVYTVRFTTSITPVANTWTQGAMVMQTVLPGGTYSIIGLEVINAGATWARLIFPGFTNRPGVIVSQGYGFRNSRYFRFGLLGEFGRFQSIATPLLEVFSIAGGGTVEGYLDLVRLPQ